MIPLIYNRISYLELGWMSSLPSLRDLSLAHNDLFAVDGSEFKNSPGLIRFIQDVMDMYTRRQNASYVEEESHNQRVAFRTRDRLLILLWRSALAERVGLHWRPNSNLRVDLGTLQLCHY